MANKRFTKMNPRSHPMQKITYHVPINWAQNFEIKNISSNIYIYGDMINKLGQYEDLGEPEEIARKLGIKNSISIGVGYATRLKPQM